MDHGIAPTRGRQPEGATWAEKWDGLIRSHGVNGDECHLVQEICSHQGPSGRLKFRDTVHVADFTDAAVLAGFNLDSAGDML